MNRFPIAKFSQNPIRQFVKIVGGLGGRLLSDFSQALYQFFHTDASLAE